MSSVRTRLLLEDVMPLFPTHPSNPVILGKLIKEIAAINSIFDQVIELWPDGSPTEFYVLLHRSGSAEAMLKSLLDPHEIRRAQLESEQIISRASYLTQKEAESLLFLGITSSHSTSLKAMSPDQKTFSSTPSIAAPETVTITPLTFSQSTKSRPVSRYPPPPPVLKAISSPKWQMKEPVAVVVPIIPSPPSSPPKSKPSPKTQMEIIPLPEIAPPKQPNPNTNPIPIPNPNHLPPSEIKPPRWTQELLDRVQIFLDAGMGINEIIASDQQLNSSEARDIVDFLIEERPWTQEMDAKLFEMRNDGEDDEDIAKELEISTADITSRLSSFRKRREYRGMTPWTQEDEDLLRNYTKRGLSPPQIAYLIKKSVDDCVNHLNLYCK